MQNSVETKQAMWNAIKSSIFKDATTKANDAMQEAQSRVDSVEEGLQKDIVQLNKELALHKGILTQLVQSRAQKAEIIQQTRRVRGVEKQMQQKRNLLGNMHRERQQLSSAAANTSVAQAMKESVDAQRMLVQISCDGADLDDLLDEVDEHRLDTADLAERLGAMGGDDDGDLVDEQAFDADEVMSALGWQTDHGDMLLVDEIQHRLKIGKTTANPVNNNRDAYSREEDTDGNLSVSDTWKREELSDDAALRPSAYEWPEAPSTGEALGNISLAQSSGGGQPNSGTGAWRF